MCKNSNICCIGPGHNHQTLFAGRHTSNSLFQNKRHNIQPSYHIRWRPQVRRTSTQAIGNESQDTSSPLLLDEIRRSFTTRHASRSIKQEGKPRICVLGAGVIGLTTAIRSAGAARQLFMLAHHVAHLSDFCVPQAPGSASNLLLQSATGTLMCLQVAYRAVVLLEKVVCPPCRLTRAIPDAQVTMYAGRFASDVTSHNAAGVWEPYKLSETPEMLTYRQAVCTCQALQGLHNGGSIHVCYHMVHCQSGK